MCAARQPESERARKRLLESGLPSGSWALDEFVDDRHCLIFDDGRWVAGFSERGQFYVRFSEEDVDEAVGQFITWVESVYESTRLSSEATSRWLERLGKKRP